MATIGLELTPTHVRAVRRAWRGVPRPLEVVWDPDAPEEAAAAVRLQFGTATSVRVAVSPLLLRVKELALPGVAPQEQWRAIALQPARYFAEGDESGAMAVAWHAESRLAFAADDSRVQRWVAAFRTLGAVTLVVPSPIALQYCGLPDAAYLVAAAGDGVATATLRDGRLVHARVARRSSAAQTQALPVGEGLAGEWSAARGAAMARASDDWESLTTPETQRGLRTRRMRALYASAAALGVALVAALAALDYARASYETRLNAAIAVAERDAQPGLALRRRLAGLEREAQLLRASAGTGDAARTLAALSELLPRSVVLTRVRMSGDEWQASGRARGGDAAAVVPALERDARFADVRMTAPSTRFREDAAEYESFSVAFRVRPSD